MIHMTTKPNVLIDNREPDWIVNGLKTYDEIKIEKRQLPVGDIVINGRACIERKEINNLITDVQSSNSTKPWSQLKNMKDNFKRNFLIVHGSRRDIDTYRVPEQDIEKYLDRKMKMIRGVGLSIQLKWMMVYLRVEDLMSFLETIWTIFKREMKLNRSYKPYSAVKRDSTLRERLVAILCNVPNVGPSRAEKLVDTKKSLRNIARMNQYDLKDLMGEKTGENIFKVFNKSID